MSRLLPLLLLFSALAQGTTPPCLISFGTLPADIENPAPLIAATYRELLNQLGAGLKPATFQKMAEGKDPFAVPEEPGMDVLTLNRRLGDFKKMLEAKGWINPAVTAQLVTDLKTRAGALKEAETRLDRVVVEGFSDHEMFPFPAAIATSPDARYVMALTRRGKNPSPEYLVYDTATRAITPLPVTGPKMGDPIFSSDGKYVIMADSERRLHAFPIVKGQLAGPSKVLGKSNGTGENTWLTEIYPGKTPDRFIAMDPSAYPTPYLFDISGKRTPIALKQYLNGDPLINDRGIVPGTDELFLLVQDATKYQFHQVTVGKDGAVSKVKLREWNNVVAEQARYLPDGKSVLLANSKEVAILGEHDRVPSLVYEQYANASPHERVIRQVLPHPAGKLTAILVKTGEQLRVDWLDLVSRKVVDSFELPSTQYVNAQLVFAPDGKALYVRDKDFHWRALNYKERLKPETLK